MLGNRKIILDKVKSEIITDLTQNKGYEISFDHKDIMLSNTSKVSNFTFSLLDGVHIVDQNGNIVTTTIETSSSPSFDSTKNGLYTITYQAEYEGHLITSERTIEVVDPIIYEYAYTGREQQFIAPANGVYQVELWGAQGGSISGSAYTSNGTLRSNKLTYTGGKGAYTFGNIQLGSGTNLYVHVGGAPTKENVTTDASKGTFVGGYNGGVSIKEGNQGYGAAGGGATDIRLVSGDWNNFNGLKSRIMVAAGGGGANFRNTGYGEGNGGEGGVLVGVSGYEALTPGSFHRNDYSDGYAIGLGGSQTKGGSLERHYLDGSIDKTLNGTFGGLNAINLESGGGGGYYSGASSMSGGAGGGSSYISGYMGCDAILESSTPEVMKHTGQSIHYSTRKFEDGMMKNGTEAMPTYDGTTTMTGNAGNGYAKIVVLMVENGTFATNLVENSGFEKGNIEGWSYTSSVYDPEFEDTILKSGMYSLKLVVKAASTTNDSAYQIIPTIPGHKYYATAYTNTNAKDPEKTNTKISFSPGDAWNWLESSESSSKQKNKWIKHSILYENTSNTSLKYRINMGGNPDGMTIGDYYYIDNVLMLDLTEIYGEGKEPSQEWCDENIHYFDGIGIVPKQ